MSTTTTARPGSGRLPAPAPGGPLGWLGSFSYRHRRLVALT